jgi:hypothetical protein
MAGNGAPQSERRANSELNGAPNPPYKARYFVATRY